MNVYVIKSLRGYLVANIGGPTSWSKEVRDDVWQFATRTNAGLFLKSSGLRKARVVRANVENIRPVKASIRHRSQTRCFRIWQNTTVRAMRKDLVTLGYEIISGPTPCEHGPRGYRYVHELEDWTY